MDPHISALSILLSTKVFDDEFYKNAYYAKLGGVSTSEMNTLEVEFLSLVWLSLSLRSPLPSSPSLLLSGEF
jgi:hypothetical protein